MEDDTRTVPLTYEKAILYMAGPLVFVGCASLFWCCVHFVLTMIWSGRHEREDQIDETGHQKKRSLYKTLSWRRRKEARKKSDTKNSRPEADRPEMMPATTQQTTITINSSAENESKNKVYHTGRVSTAVAHRMSTMANVSKQTLSKLNSTVTGAIDSYKGEEWTWVDTKRYLVVSTLICMVILHPTLTRQSLFLFMCVPINERIVIPGNDTTPMIQSLSFLRKDVQLECYTEQHWTFAILLGLPGVICYVIGTPVLTFYVLYQRRHKLTIEGPAGDECRKTYGFIYRGYSIYYWEVVIMSRKISMVIVAVFGLRASVQTQALMALLVVLMAGSAHIYAKPFDVLILDRLELYGLITAFITLYFGMFFFTSDVEESPFFLAVITIIIMSTNFAFVFYWSVALYHALCEEVVLFARFHVIASLCCHRFTQKYCRNCGCTKKYKRWVKRWRKHHRAEHSGSSRESGSDSDNSDDSDSDSDSSDNEVQVQRRTKDHTVWESMAADGVERENLDSIHKRRKHQLHGRRKSAKRALEMVKIRRRDSYNRAQTKLDEEIHASELDAQIRANKVNNIFNSLGVLHQDSSKNFKMLPAPNFPAPMENDVTDSRILSLPVPPPPSLPGPPGRFKVNPLAQSRWKTAMKKQAQKKNVNIKGRQHKVKRDSKPTLELLEEVNKQITVLPPGNLQRNPMQFKAGDERKEHLHEPALALPSSEKGEDGEGGGGGGSSRDGGGTSRWKTARAKFRDIKLFGKQSTKLPPAVELIKTPSMSKIQMKKKSREERLAMMRSQRNSSIEKIYYKPNRATTSPFGSGDIAEQIHVNPLLQGRSGFSERMSRSPQRKQEHDPVTGRDYVVNKRTGESEWVGEHKKYDGSK